MHSEVPILNSKKLTIFNLSHEKFEILLWSSEWTNWLHVFMLYNSADIYLFKADDPLPLSLRALKNVIQCDMVSMLEHLTQTSVKSKLFVFMEGSYKQLSSWWKDLNINFSESNFFSSIPVCMLVKGRTRSYKVFDNFRLYKISNTEDCGAVNFFHCQILVNSAIEWISPEASSVKWKLIDFINPTLKGKIVRDKPDFTTSFNPIKWKDLFHCPSVFAASGWVERTLTPHELYRILGFPRSMDSILDQEFLLSSGQLSDSFNKVIKCPPNSILLKVLESISHFPKLTGSSENEEMLNETN